MRIFDLETNGLLNELDRVWCSWDYDTRSETFTGHRPDTVHQLWRELADEPDGIVAHNGLDFDLDALEKVYGLAEGFSAFKKHAHDEIGTWFLDTLILSRLLYPDIGPMDWASYNAGRLTGFPNTPEARKKLFGNHNLKSWGYRLGVLKGEFGDDADWSKFTEEMYTYNKQDVEVTRALFEHFEAKASRLPSTWCIQLEHQFALYLYHQMRAGVSFDRTKAEMLVMYWKRELSKRLSQMRAIVPDIIIEEDWVPKRNNKTRGLVAGETVTKRKVIPFNPRSSDHIIGFLQHKYNWEPTEFTNKKSDRWPNGKPQVTHQVLSELTYPEAPLLARIKLLMDRIALVSTSPASWIKCIKEETGRIHGRIIHNGTPTSRCRHSGPNLGNIPSPKAVWGKTLRGLFQAQEGWDLVGCDADGLEMRLLSHYLYPYDKGAFFESAFNGSKADGTDCHSKNMVAINNELREAGFPDLATVNREAAKTIFYAILYGAFPKKVASILTKFAGIQLPKHRQYAIGQLIINAIRANVEGLEQLLESLEDTYNEQKDRGVWCPHLYMPDGRPCPIRSLHAILNSANQTLGSVVMKVALVLFMQKMEYHGLMIGVDWNPLLFVHDEAQVETRPGTITVNGVEERICDFTGRLLAESIATAGEMLKINVPLVGTWSVGKTWADTH